MTENDRRTMGNIEFGVQRTNTLLNGILIITVVTLVIAAVNLVT